MEGEISLQWSRCRKLPRESDGHTIRGEESVNALYGEEGEG